MNLEQRIISLVGISNILSQFISDKKVNSPTFLEIEEIILLAENRNPWFTRENILLALKYWSTILTYDNISQWLSLYNLAYNSQPKKNIGLILAGNIPMVGLHDCISVLLTNNRALIKLSSKDNVLIPFFLNLWKEYDAEIEFKFMERLKKYDAVITTGSNNTAKYFEYYFKDIPHVIRQNRTSIAVLSGNETEKDLNELAKDIFMYYGLGCRNVTQVFIPESSKLDSLFQAFYPYQDIVNHNKYANNYDYNKAIYLMNNETFWDNNFVMLKESDELYSPIGVVYFKKYKNINEINRYTTSNKDNIQCIASNFEIEGISSVQLGKTQNPEIYDYADGVDTIKFLLSV